MEPNSKKSSPSHYHSEYYLKPREIVIFTGDETDESPPKLPPVSGVLASSECEHPIIRPSPVRPSPALQHPSSIWSSPSTGYGSGSSGSCCSDARSLSFLEEPDHGASSDDSSHRESPRCGVPISGLRVTKRLWRSSPSSTGQSSESNDIETILKDKMAEISLLRRTLEENEQVIVKVYAEKEQIWRTEIDRVKRHYENKLEELRQETAKQILKYSELKNTNANCCNCQNQNGPFVEFWPGGSPERDTNTHNRRQSLALPTNKWSEKNCRNLSRIREYDSNRSILVSSSVCNLNEYKEEKKMFGESKGSLNDEEKLRVEVSALKTELSQAKKDLHQEREKVQEDRKRWTEERERLASYQEQLHQNYIQAWKRGRILEAQVQATKAQLDKLLHESQC